PRLVLVPADGASLHGASISSRTRRNLTYESTDRPAGVTSGAPSGASDAAVIDLRPVGEGEEPVRPVRLEELRQRLLEAVEGGALGRDVRAREQPPAQPRVVEPLRVLERHLADGTGEEAHERRGVDAPVARRSV